MAAASSALIFAADWPPRGARVRAFGRRCPFPHELDGVEWRQGDLSDTARLTSAIELFDIVFHLVHTNVPQSANLDMAEDVRQNVIPSLALLEIARKLQVQRIVFVSSGGTIYGATKEVPTPETAPTDPIAAYGISKLAIEKYLALYEHMYGLSFRVLRVANPFGPFQLPIKNQGVIAALISRALHGQEIEIWGTDRWSGTISSSKMLSVRCSAWLLIAAACVSSISAAVRVGAFARS